MLFRNFIYTAIVIGSIGGAIYGVYQALAVNPLIHEAEEYEIAEAVDESTSHGSAANGDDHSHNYDHDAWGPNDGMQRILSTLGSNILIGIAFSLILLAAVTWHNLKSSRAGVTTRSGIFWGIGMFITFYISPALLGLHPELPGTVAAVLENRQTWWISCVIATALGLALIYYGSAILKFAGGILILLPHLIGAPHPEVIGFANTDPAAVAELKRLTSQFILRTSIGMALFFLILGALCGRASQRLIR